MYVVVVTMNKNGIQNVLHKVVTLQMLVHLLHHFKVPVFALLFDWATNLSHSAFPWILEDICSLHQSHDTRRCWGTLDSPYHRLDQTYSWDSLKDIDWFFFFRHRKNMMANKIKGLYLIFCYSSNCIYQVKYRMQTLTLIKKKQPFKCPR